MCKLFNKIVAYDPVTRQVSQESAFPDALPQQNDLIFEPSGDFWLLCGLRTGSINQSQLRHYRADHSLIAVYDIQLDRYPYARLLRTADGNIWISGTSGRLLRCNPATGKITPFDFGQLFGAQAPAVMTFALVEDGNGVLWAGTQLGLVKGEWKKDSLDFKLLKTDMRLHTSLNNNSIACLLPDPAEPRKRLWIGTKGGGINCLDLQTGEVSYITTEQGLPNNVVYGILPDQSGHLWCSTNRGLARLTFQQKTIINVKLFTVADGLQSNEFNTQAFFKTPGGEMLFGGVNGLNRFLPEALELKREIETLERSIQRRRNDMKQALNRRINELSETIDQRIQEEIGAYAREQGYELVLTDGVGFAHPRLDITDAILRRVNAHAAELREP